MSKTKQRDLAESGNPGGQHRAGNSEREADRSIQAPRDQPPLPTYWEAPDPLFYFETWKLKALTDAQRKEIKAGLLTLHSAFLEGQTGDSPYIECWRRAYDIFAEQFLAASVLSEDLISYAVPTMVMDASASGRWMFGLHSCQVAFGDFYRRCDTGRVELAWCRRQDQR